MINNVIDPNAPLISNINPNTSSTISSTISSGTSITQHPYSTLNYYNTNICDIDYIEWIRKNVPIIFYIKSFNQINDKQVTLNFYDNVGFYTFLPDAGSLIFLNEFYGIYYLKDYCYWSNKVTVEFNPEDINKLKEDMPFVPANQFDLKVSNEELLNFLKNNDDYKDFVHIKFEEYLNSSDLRNMNEKKRHHEELDKMFND